MNCLVGQSGGPTAVINSSLAGVIQAGIDLNYDGIFLSLNGIEGIINKNIKKVDKDLFEKNFGKDRLKKRPSSILGSCRYKLPEDLDDEVYGKIFENFKNPYRNQLSYLCRLCVFKVQEAQTCQAVTELLGNVDVVVIQLEFGVLLYPADVQFVVQQISERPGERHDLHNIDPGLDPRLITQIEHIFGGNVSGCTGNEGATA